MFTKRNFGSELSCPFSGVRVHTANFVDKYGPSKKTTTLWQRKKKNKRIRYSLFGDEAKPSPFNDDAKLAQPPVPLLISDHNAKLAPVLGLPTPKKELIINPLLQR
jgi:hypothetical protein